MTEFNWWTQTVHVHLGNTEYHAVVLWAEIIADEEPADPIAALAEKMKIRFSEEIEGLAPVLVDLLQGALDEVDWQGLAECWEDSFENLGGVKGDDGTWSWE